MDMIKTEFLKLRKSKILLSFFLLPILSAVIGTFNYLQNLGILKDEWYSLWTQHTLFLSYFFLPVLIGLIVSYSFKLENNNLNMVLSLPVSRLMFILGKFTVSCIFAVIALIFTIILYIISGYYCGFSGFPLDIIFLSVKGAMGVLTICAVQVLISIITRNFPLSIGLSFIGGISGLLMITMELWGINPYSLVAVGLNSNGSTALTTNQNLLYFVSSGFFIFTALTASNIILKKRDIKN